MSGISQHKTRLLCLRDYLLRETDEEHPVSTARLMEVLSDGGFSVERKSLYTDLELLESNGLDLQRRRQGSITVWYVGERDFQLPELRLLVDSVQASHFITSKKSLELIEKLGNLTSRHLANGLRRQVWVTHRSKSVNESIYYLVDDIHAAIARDRRVQFHYFRYNERKERELRRDGRIYEVSPFALLLDDENYYLIGYDHENGGLRHYRVDKMLRLSVTELPRQGKELFAALDMAKYTDARFGMFSGETTEVKLEFRSSLSGAVLDRFGPEAMLIPSREGYFTLNVPLAVNEPFFGWLCSFGGDVRLLSPPQAVEAFKGHLEKIRQVYFSEKST